MTSDLDAAVARHNEFYVTYREEPHRSRRAAIVAKFPEITKLNGPEPLTKWLVLAVVALQVGCAIMVKNWSPSSVGFWALAYVVGATANSNLFLAIHELSHNLGFKKPLHNKLFSIVANFPVGVPYSAGFRSYHLAHHKFMGSPECDTDLPTRLEALVLSTVAGKAFFVTFQLLFYAVRPMCVMAISFTWVHYLNIVAQVLFNVALVHTCGWTAYLYLVLSSFLAGSLHPVAGHFISEHYVMEAPESFDPHKTLFPETYSYYGPLNLVAYNVGYHNEHHDFPYVPWTRLAKVRQIAAEFYDPLPSHASWVMVVLKFVLDPNVSLWCRVRRAEKIKAMPDNEALEVS